SCSHAKQYISFNTSRCYLQATAEKIQAVYEEEAISNRVARKSFSRFREGNFDLSDSAGSGRPSDFDEEKLNALVHENPRQSTCELAEKIGCSHVTVSRHLLSMGKVLFSLNTVKQWPNVARSSARSPQHDNARPHTAIITKTAIQELGWEVPPHPGNSPDLAPSEYHLFRSLAVNLRGDSFNNDENLQKWLADFSSKPPHFYQTGDRTGGQSLERSRE
ncbi:hypothetical protein M514_09348, partial [Trichuris suis]